MVLARRALGFVGVCGFALVIGMSPAHAQEVGAQVLPFKGPPGAPVSVQVSNCPDGTANIAVRPERPAGEPSPAFDPNEAGLSILAADETGSATFALTIEPVIKPEGEYVFDVFCVDAGNNVLGDPLATSFELANLPLAVDPSTGPVGTNVTVTGGGCPVGTTDQVFIRISGASDQLTPFDPGNPGQFSTAPNADGTFSLSFAIPNDLPEGENQVESFCVSEGGSNLAGPGLTVFVVTTPTPTPAPAPLPRTGGDTRALPLALGLLLAGGALSSLSLVGRRARLRRAERF
jgi:hypothetical protein